MWMLCCVIVTISYVNVIVKLDNDRLNKLCTS